MMSRRTPSCAAQARPKTAPERLRAAPVAVRRSVSFAVRARAPASARPARGRATAEGDVAASQAVRQSRRRHRRPRHQLGGRPGGGKLGAHWRRQGKQSAVTWPHGQRHNRHEGSHERPHHQQVCCRPTLARLTGISIRIFVIIARLHRRIALLSRVSHNKHRQQPRERSHARGSACSCAQTTSLRYLGGKGRGEGGADACSQRQSGCSPCRRHGGGASVAAAAPCIDDITAVCVRQGRYSRGRAESSSSCNQCQRVGCSCQGEPRQRCRGAGDEQGGAAASCALVAVTPGVGPGAEQGYCQQLGHSKHPHRRRRDAQGGGPVGQQAQDGAGVQAAGRAGWVRGDMR